MTPADEFRKAIAESLINQTYNVCSRWAVARRTMQDGCPYSLEDYPYVEGILNSRSRFNWIMKAAQVGLTEGGITIGFFETEFHGRDVIYYFPTKRMGERFSKTRFSPAINLSPYLKMACTRDDVEIKQFGNATLHILGANSVADLRGTAAGRLIFDELDEWTDQQIYLAEERASGQKNNDTIIWGFSTPKYPNCGIHKQFLKSTQENFFFYCPHCGNLIILRWVKDSDPYDPKNNGSFVVVGTTTEDTKVYDSYLKCHDCHKKLPHGDKKTWLASGRWVATNSDANPKLSRGFWLPQLYSPTVEPHLIAIKYLQGNGDEAARREFHNSKLALPFIEDSYQVTDKQIDEAIDEHGKYALTDPSLIPVNMDSGIYTLGIDQGGPVHHWVAVKWVFRKDAFGDPNDRAIGQLVGCGRILQDSWLEVKALMRTYQIRMCVIDSDPEPTCARTFARGVCGDVVYLCEYSLTSGGGGRDIRLTDDDYGANMVKCDRTGWLSKTLGRIIHGTISLPLDLPFEFREHVKSPIRTMRKVKGRYVASYIDTDRPDHFAHALNYAEIALKILDPSLHSNQIITTII